jgi:aldehyde:ferredoxin oxidoreductase
VIGGSGLGVAVLLRERAFEHAPLAPEAPIVFALSPLVGSPLTTSAKFAVVHRSPLTDRLNDSLVSSGFAIAARRTGCDALTIVGRAERLSVLVINGTDISLRSAEHLRDAPTGVTTRQLQAELGPEYRVAVIGPAGERCVRFATISHDGRHAGRGGAGAVLGSKNLKAIAVRGDRRCRWADPAAVMAMGKDLSRRSFGPATAKYRELGTAANLLTLNRLHALPSHNFQSTQLSGAEQLSVEALRAKYPRMRASCAACTIGCEHLYQIPNRAPSEDRPIDATASNVRVEYETLFALGALCGITDSSVVLQASSMCDELGLDTISAGGTIAFAMEAVARGIWCEADLKFGRGDHLLQALDQIAFRRDWGDALAEGSRHLASQLGAEATRFAAHVKGLELPGYEPRTLQAMALGFATNSRGADHNRSGAYQVDLSDHVDRRKIDRDAVPLVIATEDQAALLDSLILCKFLRGIFPNLPAEGAQMLRQITGWSIEEGEVRQIASRIVLLKKYFNILCGWQPAEDSLPARFLEGPAEGDAARLTATQLGELVAEYNRLRGWSSSGWLTADQLRDCQQLWDDPLATNVGLDEGHA